MREYCLLHIWKLSAMHILWITNYLNIKVTGSNLIDFQLTIQKDDIYTVLKFISKIYSMFLYTYKLGKFHYRNRKDGLWLFKYVLLFSFKWIIIFLIKRINGLYH